MDSALELQRAFKTDPPRGSRILVSIRVGYVREAVVENHGVVALLAAKQRPRLPPALDDVVPDRDGLKIATTIEAKESVLARGDGGAGDDMVVANLQVVVDLVDPDDAPARITDQIIVKERGAFCGRLSEAGDQIPVIAPCR